MEIVKAFNTNTLNFNILIKGTHQNPLFRAGDIGSILEIQNINQNIKDFLEDEKIFIEISTLGGTQNVSFLTEKGLYKILFKSRKPIAEKFQNWVCDIIKEIRINGFYELKKENDLKLLELENTISKQPALEKEKVLLKQFSQNDSVVYIIKVKTLEKGQYIIKIGESRKGIQSRYIAHKSNYDECLLLDCFAVNKSKDFEYFLHNYPAIRSNKITNLERHEKENELFLIGKELTYQKVLDIIYDHIDKYSYTVKELLEKNFFLNQQINELKNENENLKIKINMIFQENPNLKDNLMNINLSNNILSEKLLNIIQNQSEKINFIATNTNIILENLTQQKEPTPLPPPPKTTTGFNQQLPTLGPRLQKINPENLQLIQVYESVTEAMNENINIKRPSIMKAIADNTIYCGFRWQLVERNLDPQTLYNIKPTVEIQQQNIGYIAKLNANKSSIMNVYLDRKTAAKLNNYKSISALDNPVKNFTITNGHFYTLYDKCEPELIAEFEERIGASPLLYKNGVGQFDLSGNMVQEFLCKYDCLRTLKMSDKTLSKALENKTPYNGFLYKELGSKLSI